MMKIARVFPTKTNMSPTDPDAYFGEPDLFTPKYDEVHISVTFTWDGYRAYELCDAWEKYGKKVLIGGPGMDRESEEPFVSGMYLKKGVTITSRGCPNSCSFCLVKNDLIEFDNFPEGNIVNDNNLLACSEKHLDLVFNMLENQKQIEFKGGLEAIRITSEIAKRLKTLNIKSLWLACDTDSALKPLEKAVDLLKLVGFKQYQIFCYALIGREHISIEAKRLRQILRIGALPFAILYQPSFNQKKEYSKEWRDFQRLWCRPAIYKSALKGRVI